MAAVIAAAKFHNLAHDYVNILKNYRENKGKNTSGDLSELREANSQKILDEVFPYQKTSDLAITALKISLLFVALALLIFGAVGLATEFKFMVSVVIHNVKISCGAAVGLGSFSLIGLAFFEKFSRDDKRWVVDRQRDFVKIVMYDQAKFQLERR